MATGKISTDTGITDPRLREYFCARARHPPRAALSAPAIRGHCHLPASLETLTNNRHQFEQNQIHSVETGINLNKIDFLYADCQQILLVPISQNQKKISK
jgi:hypothetical protein